MKWTSISQNDYQTLNYYENFIPSKLTPVERPKINMISKQRSWFKRAKETILSWFGKYSKRKLLDEDSPEFQEKLDEWAKSEEIRKDDMAKLRSNLISKFMNGVLFRTKIGDFKETFLDRDDLVQNEVDSKVEWFWVLENGDQEKFELNKILKEFFLAERGDLSNTNLQADRKNNFLALISQ